jgi:hypothetical protein
LPFAYAGENGSKTSQAKQLTAITGVKVPTIHPLVISGRSIAQRLHVRSSGGICRVMNGITGEQTFSAMTEPRAFQRCEKYSGTPIDHTGREEKPQMNDDGRR